MYSITDSSVVLRWLVGDFSSLCTTEMDLSITRLFVSKKSKHTLITPHGIGYSVWSSLTPSLLQLTELFLLILITGQYFLSSLHEFTSFGAVFHNIYKQDSLVFQVCVLRYIQVEFYYRMIYAVRQFSTFSSGSLVKSFTRTLSSIYLAQVFKSQDSRTMN